MTEGRERNIVSAYQHCHKMIFGTKWVDAPKYARVKKPQYLPTEELLLSIISGVPNKYKPFCQMLMETGMRSEEAWKLKWENINFQTGMLSVTPIKNSNSRDLPISQKLINMLGLIPRESEYVFHNGQELEYFREGFRKHRVKLAAELDEPEILKCSFKTFRTFFITRQSYKFNNPFEVQYRAGHTHMSTTELYIRREGAMKREFVNLVTRTLEEEQDAIDQGYEYVKDRDGVSLWRKPK